MLTVGKGGRTEAEVLLRREGLGVVVFCRKRRRRGRRRRGGGGGGGGEESRWSLVRGFAILGGRKIRIGFLVRPADSGLLLPGDQPSVLKRWRMRFSVAAYYSGDGSQQRVRCPKSFRCGKAFLSRTQSGYVFIAEKAAKKFSDDLQVPRHVNALNMSSLTRPEALIGSAQLIPQRAVP